MNLALGGWLQSARLLSSLHIQLPLILGQVWAYDGLAWGIPPERFWWRALGICVWGFLAQLFIVWWNDVADEAADAHNPLRTFASGGSGVLQQGLLTTQQLRQAGMGAGLALLLVEGGLACIHPVGLLQGMILWGGAQGSLACLLWAYSFAPLKLSYRGGGEWLQVIGLGGVLPVLGFLAQGGGWEALPWPVCLVMWVFQAGLAYTTTIPDYAADKAAAKRTLSVRFGPQAVSRWIFWLYQCGWCYGLAFLPLTPWQMWVFLGFSLSFTLLKGYELQADPKVGLWLRLGVGVLSLGLLCFESLHAYQAQGWAHRYPFLGLCLLLALPAGRGLSLRYEWRFMWKRLCLWSLPFALSEGFFYPDYWHPPGLGGYLERFHMGPEDFLFVTLWASVIGGFWVSYPQAWARSLARPGVGLLEKALVCVILCGSLAVGSVVGSFIEATLLAMACTWCTIAYLRPDLRGMGLRIGSCSMLLYGALLWIFERLYPGGLELYWSVPPPEGIPVWTYELGYAFASGALGGVFYPFFYSKPITSSHPYPEASGIAQTMNEY